MIVEDVVQAHLEFHILAAVIKPDHCGKNVKLNMSLSGAFDDHSELKQLFPLSFAKGGGSTYPPILANHSLEEKAEGL